MGCCTSTSWGEGATPPRPVYWRYGPLKENPLMCPLSVYKGMGEGMGPDGFWPGARVEMADESGTVVAVNGSEPSADLLRLVLRVSAKGKLLQELPLAFVECCMVHKVEGVNFRHTTRSPWIHVFLVQSRSTNESLYINGVGSAKWLLKVLEMAGIAVDCLDQRAFFSRVREAQKVPIGPPGVTEFVACKLQITNVRERCTVQLAGEVLAPGVPGRDDTEHFQMDPEKFRQQYGGHHV